MSSANQLWNQYFIKINNMEMQWMCIQRQQLLDNGM